MAVVTGSSAAVSGPLSALPTTPDESTDSLLLTLEVTRGHTMYPHRPVAGPRFLIGSGVGCHLRLGGPDLPTLHSLIVIDSAEVTLESIALEPPLIVNGRRVTSASLSHGDRIEVGPFQLTARMIPPHAALPAEIKLPASAFVEDERLPADLSALELVERLDGELQMVEDFDTRRELGAVALLEVVQHQQTTPIVQPTQELALPKTDRIWRVDGTAVPAPHFTLPRLPDPVLKRDDVFVDDLQRLHDDLQRFSRLLEARAERLSHQEASVAEAASELFEAQQRLSQQLEFLLSQTKSHAESQRVAETLVLAIA